MRYALQASAQSEQATLRYLRGKDDASVAAIHRTLELEPRRCGCTRCTRAGGAR